jgi:hypothetical protein
VTVFFAVSALAAYASRASFGRPRSHGLVRFFAWECIIGLIVLNFRGFGEWFRDPLSARQLGSWFLLAFSLLPLGLGVHRLRTLGEPDASARRDPTLFPIEQTTRLVTTGVYHYIRHPIYASLLFLTWGVFLKTPSRLGAGLAMAASVFVFATAVAEERENASYFGAAYEAYRRHTKRFIPFLF